MVRISWEPRDPPLRPEAILGRGDRIQALAAALMERVEHGADLRMFAGPGVLLAIGDEADLPWVDGVTWLGQESRLLVPTTLRVVPSADLVARAIDRRVGEGGWRVLLPDGLLMGDRQPGLPDLDSLRVLAGRP